MNTNKHFMKMLYFLLVIILWQTAAYAQVVVQFNQPPQYQFKLEHMWKVTLINPTNATYSVYLHGAAAESSTGLIVEADTKVFNLSPGIHVVTASDIQPVDVKSSNIRFDDIVKNIGGVPSGEYEICVSVIHSGTNELLGEQCIEQEVLNLTQVELIGPDNTAVIESLTDNNESLENVHITNGSYITFSWMPPSPVDQTKLLTYSIRIIEMIGRQSAYDAFHSNPAFYQSGLITTTIFQFPSKARDFNPGKRYAWQVSAYVNGTLISESEIWEFAFGKEGPVSYNENPISFMPSGLSEFISQNMNQYNQQNIFSNHAPGLYRSDDDSESPILISGSASIEMQTANRPGSDSEIEKQYTNLELNPSIQLYGIPLSANFLISSQQDELRQNINSFSLNFDLPALKSNMMERLEQKTEELSGMDIESLKDQISDLSSVEARLKELENRSDLSDAEKMEADSLKTTLAELRSIEEKIEMYNNLQDPGMLKENLNNYGLISGSENLLMSVQTFGIGTNYPEYTQHTLSGVPVTGINLEITPSILYFAFTGTLNQKGIVNRDFQRNLFAGRLGVGSKDESHFHFTGLFARDDENSIVVDPTNLTLTPKANYLFGIDGALTLFDESIKLEGEAAGSMLTRDVREPSLENPSIPKFVRNLVEPNISSSFDYMYAVKTSYNNNESNTKVSVGFKMIGPGYTSLGTPNLKSDYFGFEGKFEQKLINRSVSFSASIKRQVDNLIDWKSSTSTLTSMNFNVGFTFPELPMLMLMYSPNLQKNDATDILSKVNNRTSMISVVTSYYYPVFETQSSTYFSFSSQRSKTLISIADFSSESYMITQSATFETPFTLSASTGIIHLRSAGMYSRLTTFDLSAAFPVFEILQSTIGFRNAIEKSRNNKYGFYILASISLFENINLDLQADQVAYHDWVTIGGIESYDEAIVKATIRANW